jgi:Ca2+/H+ antiporter, TMEM165/GDT1 family
LWVALGTSLGMLLANVPVIYAGQALIQRLPVTLAQRLAALVFIALGLGVVYYRLASG